jgi:hypothetical protein
MANLRFSDVELSSRGAPNLIESFATLYFVKLLDENFASENSYGG